MDFEVGIGIGREMLVEGLEVEWDAILVVVSGIMGVNMREKRKSHAFDANNDDVVLGNVRSSFERIINTFVILMLRDEPQILKCKLSME